jgi:hypothetical protein
MPKKIRQRLNWQFFSFACLAAFFLSSCASTESTAVNKRGEIPPDAIEIYTVSGLEVQMQSVGPQIVFGLHQQQSRLPPQVYDVLESVAREQFASNALRSRALEVIVASWNQDYATVALAWLNTDLGRRITRLEEYSSSSEGMVGIQQYAAGLQRRPPSAQRVAAIKRLNEAYGGTDFLVDSTLAMTLAVAVGANAASPEDEQLDLVALRDAVEKDRVNLRQQMDELVLLYHLFTYSGMIDEEIAAYADFLESDVGSWYVDTLARAYIKPLVDLSMELGAALKQALDESSSATGL